MHRRERSGRRLGRERRRRPLKGQDVLLPREVDHGLKLISVEIMRDDSFMKLRLAHVHCDAPSIIHMMEKLKLLLQMIIK